MMNKIFRYLAWMMAIAAATLTACSDEGVNYELPGDDMGDITLTLNIPDFEQQQLMSRAVSESAIKSVSVVGYDASGTCRSFNTYTADQLSVSGNQVTMRVGLPKGVNRIEIVANADNLLTSAPTAALTQVYNSESLAAATHLVFWGKATMADLVGGAVTANMVRQTAKVTAVNNATSTFTLTGVKVTGTATKGSVAPNLDGSGNNMLTIPSSDPYNVASTYVAANSPVYIYETPADKPVMIVKGRYNGSEYYYKVGFFGQGTNNRIPLQRNHHYTLTIKEVLGTGCATEADALNGDFTNRLVVELRDHDERIFNLVGNNDYALGVGDNINAAASATSVDLPIITLAASTDLFETPVIEIEAGAKSWITGANVGSYTTVANGTYTSPARSFTVKLALTANSSSTATRTGRLTVRYRDLQQVVVVSQDGTDFKRDAARAVTYYSSSSTVVTSNYFNWIDTQVKGITPPAMQGVVRNDGLHFSTETDAAQQYYLIPYLSGDVLKSVGKSNITVTRSGNYWKVALNNGSTAETAMWASQFVITNAAGIDIVYPVYRTGVFHNISSSVASTYQVPEDKKTGWYYYETVAVKGTDGKTYYVLDRNLGAEGNGPFSIASASLASNNNTVGAYYKISNASAGDNIKPQICPAGFTVPSSTILTAINFKPGTFTTAAGEKYNCASVATQSSYIPRIYLPTGGYTAGNNYKDSNHANVWSSTYLSGAQGFSTGSVEFRFWFLYYDAHGNVSGISNMRFVNGGGGQIGSIYRGMPVRCVRGNSSTANDGGTSGEINTITIYWSNSSTNWTPPYVYTYNSGGSSDTSGAWPGKTMTYQTGAVYRAVVPKGSMLVFSNNGSSQYPSSGGYTAVDGHIYGPAGDMGAYSTSGIQVFWDNSSSTSWSAPKVYYWKSSNTSDNAGGTGKSMTHVSGNIWTYTIPAGYDRLIMNKGSWGTVGSDQTCDMVLTTGIVYSLSNHYTHKAN